MPFNTTPVVVALGGTTPSSFGAASRFRRSRLNTSRYYAVWTETYPPASSYIIYADRPNVMLGTGTGCYSDGTLIEGVSQNLMNTGSRIEGNPGCIALGADDSFHWIVPADDAVSVNYPGIYGNSEGGRKNTGYFPWFGSSFSDLLTYEHLYVDSVGKKAYIFGPGTSQTIMGKVYCPLAYRVYDYNTNTLGAEVVPIVPTTVDSTGDWVCTLPSISIMRVHSTSPTKIWVSYVCQSTGGTAVNKWAIMAIDLATGVGTHLYKTAETGCISPYNDTAWYGFRLPEEPYISGANRVIHGALCQLSYSSNTVASPIRMIRLTYTDATWTAPTIVTYNSNITLPAGAGSGPTIGLRHAILSSCSYEYEVSSGQNYLIYFIAGDDDPTANQSRVWGYYKDLNTTSGDFVALASPITTYARNAGDSADNTRSMSGGSRYTVLANTTQGTILRVTHGNTTTGANEQNIVLWVDFWGPIPPNYVDVPVTLPLTMGISMLVPWTHLVPVPLTITMEWNLTIPTEWRVPVDLPISLGVSIGAVVDSGLIFVNEYTLISGISFSDYAVALPLSLGVSMSPALDYIAAISINLPLVVEINLPASIKNEPITLPITSSVVLTYALDYVPTVLVDIQPTITVQVSGDTVANVLLPISLGASVGTALDYQPTVAVAANCNILVYPSIWANVYPIIVSPSLNLVVDHNYYDYFVTTIFDLKKPITINEVVDHMPWDIPVELSLQLGMTINHNYNDKFVSVPLAITASVVVNEQVGQVVQVQLHVNHAVFGLDYFDEVVDRINIERTANSLPLINHAGVGWVPWNTSDPAQVRANDMARTGTTALDSGLYTTGFQTAAELDSYIGDPMSGTVGATRMFYPSTNRGGNYELVLTSDLPTATTFVNALSAGTKLNNWFPHVNQNLQMQLGIFLGDPHDNFATSANLFVMFIRLYDVSTAVASTTTIPPTYLTLGVNYMTMGITYIEEFLGYVNNARETYGLPLFKVPTKAIYEAYRDMAQYHSDQMATLRIFGHEGVPPHSFNMGFDSEAQRTESMRYAASSWENLLLTNVGYNYDPDNQVLPAQEFSNHILNNNTVYTPYQLFYAWWTSPGHRANLLRDMEALGANPLECYSFLGLSVGYSDLWNTLSGSAVPEIDRGTEWYLYFTNFVIDLGAVVADIYLNLNYDLTGSPIIDFGFSYDLVTYTHVKNSHSSVYSLRLGMENFAQYGVRVGTQHQAMLGFLVNATHQARYSPTVPTGAQHSGLYDIRARLAVANTLDSRYASRVGAANIGAYGIVPKARSSMQTYYGNKPLVGMAHQAVFNYKPQVSASFSSPYGQVPRASATHWVEYGTLSKVVATMKATYLIRSGVSADCEAAYLNLVPVKADCSVIYDIKTVNPVEGSHKSLWVNTSVVAPVEVDDVTCTIGGVIISDIDDLMVSMEEGQAYLTVDMSLRTTASYQLVELGMPIVVTISGTTYNFIVTGKSRNRSEDDISVSISGASPVIVLGAPYATQIDVSLASPANASTLVSDLIGPVSWGMIDWLIPSDRVQFSGVTPLDAATTIVAAAGGVIQSNPDGSVSARKLYPITTTQYDTAAVSATYSSAVDVFDMQETSHAGEGYNRFRVMDVSESLADSFEWNLDEGSWNTGTLVFRPYPWRSNFEIVENSAYAQPLIGEVVEASHTETVEFKDWMGSTPVPVYALESVQWITPSLGTVSHVQYTTGLSIAGDRTGVGYGLAVVKYLSRAYHYKVIRNETTQFLAREV